jgi:hypothetical protein
VVALDVQRTHTVSCQDELPDRKQDEQMSQANESTTGADLLSISDIHDLLRSERINPGDFWDWSMGGDRREMAEQELRRLMSQFREAK